MKFSFTVAVALMLMGCGAADVTSPLPSVDFAKQIDETKLPNSKTAEAAGAVTATVLGNDAHLLLERDDYPIASFSASERKELRQKGLPARTKHGGANDLLISPLYQGLLWSAKRDNKASSRVLLLADHDTAFRTILEIAYTAGQAQLELSLGVGPNGKKALALTAPNLVPAATRIRSRALQLVVSVGADGFSVKTSAGNVAPGCNAVGAGLTVPNKGDAYDFGGLTACVRKVKEASSNADEDLATMTGTPDVPLHVLVDTMDALRDGALFPRITLGVAQ